MLKSILAIAAGWVATVALVVLSDIVLGQLFPVATEATELPSTYLIGNIVGGFIAAMVGGYLAASLSPKSGLLHVGILAAIHLAMAVPMILAGPQALQPEWYPIVIAFIGVVGTIDGGMIWRYLGGGRRFAYAV